MELTIQHVENLTLPASASDVDDDAIQSLFARQHNFSTPDLDPDSLSYTREGDWDGSAAMSAAPNPSDGEDAQQALRRMVALYPTGDEAADNKANYKLPFRQSPDGPVHLGGVSAAIAAVNGARGGVDAPEDDLREAFNFLVRLAVAGGLYDDRDEAPEFSASDPSDDAKDTDFRASVDAAGSTTTEGITGVVWAAGDHTMYVDGKPTPVFVPPESIPETFQAIQERVQAGEPPIIGLDHGDSLHADQVPVATELDILKVGRAEQFALSEDEEQIVLTDSELTNDQVVQAKESGGLDDFDLSITGTLSIPRGDDGDPLTQDGRLVVVARDVDQVDIVRTGGVEQATITNDLPPLSPAASQAVEHPTREAAAFRSSLRVMAKRTTDLSMENLDELDLDDASPSDVYAKAEEVVQAKDDTIQRLTTVVNAAGLDPEDAEEDDMEAIVQAADAAEALADAHDVDLHAEGGVEELINEHTADLRRDVAAKEATLPGYDTGTDDGPSVEERTEELAGTDPVDLQAKQGELANEILQSDQARQEYAKANASGDGVAGSGSGGDGGADDEEAEAFAKAAFTAEDAALFRESDKDAVEFMASRYGEEPDPDKWDNPTEYLLEVAAEEA